MWYVRKYDPLLWNGKCCLDAVSLSDLHTEDNDISIWKVLSDKSNMDDIALAMAMTRDKFKDFYVVYIAPSEVNRLGLKMNPKPGNTRYIAMQNEHDNIIVPTFWEIGFLTEHMHFLVNDPIKIRYFSEPELQEFLYNAVKAGKLAKSTIMTDKNYKKYKQPLQEMEKIYGAI